MSGWSVGSWVLAVSVNPILGGAVALGSSAALVRKLSDLPPRAAFLLAWRGNLFAGTQLASAIRRTWWPLLGLVALRSRRARIALLLAAVAARHPLRVLDDGAYSIGVWRGVIRERTLGPLVPEIRSWPGRRASSRPSDAERNRTPRVRPARRGAGPRRRYGASA